MKKRTVRWLLVRHGEHKDGHLTEEGKQQVRGSVAKHLQGVVPDFLFSSELARARETALEAARVLSELGSRWSVTPDEGFGFSFPQEVLGKQWPYFEALKQVTDHEAVSGRRVSVLDVFTKYWPLAIMVGGMLYKTMLARSEELVKLDQSSGQDEVVCLVGTHGTMVYATLDPKGTPGNVGYGEIMEYVFEAENGDAKLISSKLLTSTL